MEQAKKRARLSQELDSLRNEHSETLKFLEETVMLRLVDHLADALPIDSLIKEVRYIFHQANGTLEEEEPGCEVEEEFTIFEDGDKFPVKLESWLITSPVQSVMSNHVIVTEILKYLPFKDLKSSRGVCRSWNWIGTKELEARNCCQITLWDMASDDNCRVGSRYSSTTLQDLLVVMAESETIPCSNFRVHSESLSKMIPFFDSHGHDVRSLTMTRLDTIVNLGYVLKMCTNLEYLKLDLSEYLSELNVEGFFKLFPDKNVGGRHCQVFLPSLLYLEVTLEDDSWINPYVEGRILTALIHASPNLVELRNFKSNLIESVVLLNRINLIKTIHFKPSKENLESFVLLANHQPLLEGLTFECFRMSPAKIETMRKLLESSHRSLISLRTDPLGVLGNDPITNPFGNLQHLTIHHRNVSSSVLPGGIGFASRMFPTLRSVRFEIRVKRPAVNNLFVFRASNKETFQTDQIPTVRVVEVLNEMDSHGLQLIVIKFPNITKITLKETYLPVKLTGSRIWELLPSKLQSLEIFDSTFQFHIEEKNFDCIFTGIPLAVCKNLLREQNVPNGSNPVKRTKSWIGQLTHLRKLRFILHQEESYMNYADWALSSVTAAHGFTLMERLQVVIGYDLQHRMKTVLQKKLEPLEPFVIIQHVPTSF
ncbi:unnamed protein product [Allacma fusca]|uniref:F-box domain-containing protein n=1 Tax=Allacma fusca TaxID=39272 RepID=A0A8J2P7X6_9HEXA|nr:unnamed protein product [Allacma fusca]